MNIQELTDDWTLSEDAIKNARLIRSDEHGALRLVRLEHGSKETDNALVSSALMFQPEDGSQPMLVCAGTTGKWMQDQADAFILSRGHMEATGLERVVVSTCPDDVFEAAVREGFNLVQHPNGEMELRKDLDGARLSIHNEEWAGDDASWSIDGVNKSEKTWQLTRAEIEDGEEVAHTTIAAPMTFAEAVASSEVLSQVDPARHPDGSLDKLFVFEGRDAFHAELGVAPSDRDIYADCSFENEVPQFDAAPVMAAIRDELGIVDHSEIKEAPEAPRFETEMTDAGEQFAMF